MTYTNSREKTKNQLFIGTDVCSFSFLACHYLPEIRLLYSSGHSDSFYACRNTSSPHTVQFGLSSIPNLKRCFHKETYPMKATLVLLDFERMFDIGFSISYFESHIIFSFKIENSFFLL